MIMEGTAFKLFSEAAELCKNINKSPSDLKLLENFRIFVEGAPNSFASGAQKVLISCLFPYIAAVSKDRNSQGKHVLVQTLDTLFPKITIDNSSVFNNLYTFLLLELYDYRQHKVLPICEEYKTSLLKCMTSLMNSISYELVEELYVNEYIPQFSQIIYVCTELARHERAKNIRLEAITCIMAVARVEKTESDPVFLNQCANIFMFFLPGLSAAFSEIVLEDHKAGHKLIVLTLRAYGKIVSLVMRDYNAFDQKLDITENLNRFTIKGKLKGKKEIDQYLKNTIRNSEWYRHNDSNLNVNLKKLWKLTYHSEDKVRRELFMMASIIIRDCAGTMPQSVSTLLEHLIMLSQDSVNDIVNSSTKRIESFSQILSNGHFHSVFEYLEDGFYNSLTSLPRTFNSIDDGEKIANLNLIIGYIHLFGDKGLNQIMLSPGMLQTMLENLLHIIALEACNISLLEEYNLKDLTSEYMSSKRPWINFHYFKDNCIEAKFVSLAKQLSKSESFEVICDCLVGKFRYEETKKKEVICLLNTFIFGLDSNISLIKSILNLYMEDSLNDLNYALDSEEFTLEQIQNNVLIVCLITEGIGNISQVLKHDFRPLLLKSLYLVLEKAGSGHPLIKAAGLQTLQKLTLNCDYNNLTHLISSNFDFFSYQVQRKLTKLDDKEGVLNVLSIVLQHCSEDLLLPMKYIIEEILVLSCDEFKDRYANSYLTVFKMFILSLCRWYKVDVKQENVKSRAEKEKAEEESFRVTGIDYNSGFTDDIMEGKSGEELYWEDVKRKAQEEEDNDHIEEGDSTKPRPPMHVELASIILKRSLHFLPSKDQSQRLLVLEILENGIELLRDWEDELLPTVHQIWCPLVRRFHVDSDYVTLRICVRLLTALARLAKDFIRLRVVKELLRKLIEILEHSAQASYLQDKGAAYRYSQQYKFQLELLSSMGYLLYYLGVDGGILKEVIGGIKVYLSDKHPLQLQVGAIEFFKMMLIYDEEPVKEAIAALRGSLKGVEFDKNINYLQSL
ncbi:TELO2-interacting protein 1 homolog isoform X2 [Euwallacea fornicatus]|uniref:TELO2-interacting protein 1 homolog isoform X2 n=1 Tax=Euwallacea fornicatus TaxID=995702 RepID=UPI00338DC437